MSPISQLLVVQSMGDTPRHNGHTADYIQKCEPPMGIIHLQIAFKRKMWNIESTFYEIVDYRINILRPVNRNKS